MKEDIYEKIEKVTNIDAKTEAQILKALNIVQTFAFLDERLQTGKIKRRQPLNDVVITLTAEHADLGEFGEMKIEKVMEILRQRWRDLKNELNKKGIAGF